MHPAGDHRDISIRRNTDPVGPPRAWSVPCALVPRAALVVALLVLRGVAPLLIGNAQNKILQGEQSCVLI
jgi:hypothetical protein